VPSVVVWRRGDNQAVDLEAEGGSRRQVWHPALWIPLQSREKPISASEKRPYGVGFLLIIQWHGPISA
jgi:hypothetical protein